MEFSLCRLYALEEYAVAVHDGACDCWSSVGVNHVARCSVVDLNCKRAFTLLVDYSAVA